MQIYQSLIYISLLFLFAGCSNSTMQMPTKNRLTISNAQTTIAFSIQEVANKKITLYPLYIDQNIIAADDLHCLVYEEVTLAPGHRFNYGYARSIDLIFDAKKVEERKSYGDLTLYQVTLQDRTVLNLLALTASKKSLKLLYGLDPQEIGFLEKSFEHNGTMDVYRLSGSTERREHCFKSCWQPTLLIIDNLVGEEGGNIPRRDR